MSRMIVTDSGFAEDQRAVLRRLAALMIPADGELPSAADPVIFGDVLARLAARAEVASDGLARIGAIAPGAQFVSMSATEQHAVVSRLRTECPAFVALFETAVAACYYRDDRVLSALGLPPRAPYPEGNAVAPTDWALLDPVRAREPFYREV
jgi:hypothetical protein